MTTQKIEVEGLPKGWKAKEVRIDPDQYNKYVGDDGFLYWGAKIKMEKIQPRRIVLEETGEERNRPRLNSYTYFYTDSEGFEIFKVLREVKETDIPLISEDANVKMIDEKMTLTKKDMRDLVDHIKLGGQLNHKVAEFIKDK